MPFPLAHPAAVLPLRRYCPRVFSFPALVIGSLSPDAGYLFGEGKVGEFSHQFLGSFGFCLPVGLVMLALYYFLRAPVVGALPAPYQQALVPFCRRPLGPPWVVVISLLLGIWTHLFWDSFTHTDGWFVQHVPALQTPLIIMGSRTARVCHLLWYGCSFAGVACVFVVFERWKQTCSGSAAAPLGKAMLRDAVLLGILMLPIQLVHHFIRGKLGLLLMLVLAVSVAAGVLLRMRKRPLK